VVLAIIFATKLLTRRSNQPMCNLDLNSTKVWLSFPLLLLKPFCRVSI